MSKLASEIMPVIRESANESGRSFRAYFLSFVVITFYVLTIASSTNHEILFRSGSVVMPIINIAVPITWFFSVAPWLILLLHINLIIQAIFLSEKLENFRSELDTLSIDKEHKDNATLSLISVPIVHVLARRVQKKDISLLLKVFVVSSFVILPILCLSYLLIQFLPYQSKAITELNRICLLVDILVLLLVSPRINSPHSSYLRWWRSRRKFLCLAGLSVVLVFFLFTLSTAVPGSFWDTRIPQFGLQHLFLRHIELPGRTLVLEEPSPEILSSIFSECNAANRDTYVDCNKVIAPGSKQWCRQAKGLNLKDRHFREGDFSNSILCSVDLRGTDLSTVNFEDAILYGANFANADMSGGFLSSAILGQANFSGANLSDANLVNAKLHDANFTVKQEATSHLDFGNGARGRSSGTLAKQPDVTKLHRTNLRDAKLHGVNLDFADLYGADLQYAKIFGADLNWTKMHNANLHAAKIFASRLRNSELIGANLDSASIYGSDLTSATLIKASWSSRIDIRASLFYRANFEDVKIYESENRSGMDGESSIRLSDFNRASCSQSPPETVSMVERYEREGNEDLENGRKGKSIANFSEWVEKRGQENYFGHFKGCWSGRSPEKDNPWYKGDSSNRAGFATERQKFLLNQLACWDASGYVAKSIIREIIRVQGVEDMLREADKADDDSCAGLVRGWRMYLSSEARVE